MSASLPATKSELLERMGRSRAALEALIESVPDAMLTVPGPDGWSIKDHLAHLATWEAGIVALLDRQPRYQAMGLEAAWVRGRDFTAINAAIDERNKQFSLADVRSMLTQVHDSLLATLALLTDEDLQRAYSFYQPDEPRDDSGEPIMKWVASNTYSHYDKHMESIRARLGRPLCE